MPESLSLQTLVPYLVDNNATIVSTLVLIIILLSVFLGFRSFLSAKNADSLQGAEPSMAHLEETLKKLLERADQVPTAASVGSGASAENTALLKEIEDLKNSLAEKQVQMEILERKSGSEPAPAGAGLSSAEKDAMASQIKDLQARLSEYEIISEDIADLSFFREENAKLQKELESIKKGGGASTSSSPAPAAQAAAPPAASAPEPAVTSTATSATTVASAVSPDDTDVGQDLVDKLLEQHSAAAPAPAESSAIGSSSDLDVEKMVAEAAALQSAPVDDKNALEDTLDSDKLLAEAAGMDGKINPEDAKLMGEFEDFMKKGGVG